MIALLLCWLCGEQTPRLSRIFVRASLLARLAFALATACGGAQ